MKKITTSTGFTFDLNENILDDMRLVRQIKLLQSGQDNPNIIITANNVLEKLVGGEDNYDRLLTHLEEISEDGIAHSHAVMKELTDVLNEIGDDGKKS